MNKNTVKVAEIPVPERKGQRVKEVKEEGEEKKLKQSKELTMDNVVKHMLGKKVYDSSPFPEKFIVSSPEPGTYVIYREIGDQKIVTKVNINFVIDTVIRWARDSWEIYPDLLITPTFAKEIARSWLGAVDKIPDVIKSFEFLDGSDYVTHRVPFVPDMHADFSHVDIKSPDWCARHPYLEFLSRCSSPDQLAAFVGSIFCQESYMQQYLVIWGDGNDGKGSLIRALEKILDKAFHADSFEYVAGRFWTSSFIGKRLIVFPDNNHQGAMQKGIWKQLTGGDSVRVEFKNETTFTARLNAKYLISQNGAPVLKMDRADQRRALVVHVESIKGKIDPKVEQHLAEWDELKFMVEYSCWVYRKLCPGHLPIPIPKEQHEHIHNADEDIEQRILSKFQFGSSLFVLPLHEIWEGIAGTVAMNRLGTILCSRFGCTSFRAREGGRYSSRKVYVVGVGRIGVSQEVHEQYYPKLKNLENYKEAVAEWDAKNPKANE